MTTYRTTSLRRRGKYTIRPTRAKYLRDVIQLSARRIRHSAYAYTHHIEIGTVSLPVNSRCARVSGVGYCYSRGRRPTPCRRQHAVPLAKSSCCSVSAPTADLYNVHTPRIRSGSLLEFNQQYSVVIHCRSTPQSAHNFCYTGRQTNTDQNTTAANLWKIRPSRVQTVRSVARDLISSWAMQPQVTTEPNTQGEVTSHNLCSRCDRHFVGITRHSLWSYGAKI